MDATFVTDRLWLENKFRKPSPDPTTGLSFEEIKSKVLQLADRLAGEPHEIIKAKAFAYAVKHMQIDVNKHDWFVSFGCLNGDRCDRPLNEIVYRWDREVDHTLLRHKQLLDEQNQTGTAIMWKDFDHSVPDWDAVFSLGFRGLRRRARQYRRQHQKAGTLGAAEAAYFDGIELVYTAILDTIKRFRDYALKHVNTNPRAHKVAACLDALYQGPPQDTYQVLQLVYLFFMFGEHFDRFQVRSLGNLDRTVWPYYQRDLAAGRYTEAEIRNLWCYFLMQWASIDNYWGHPFYLGGTKADGTTEVNALTYLILEEFDQLSIPTPKIQIKIAANTPDRLINLALDMIRRGHNSLVFVGEESIKRALLKIGCTDEEARTCAITGCYEFIPLARGNGTGTAHINMLKPIELVLGNGVDPLTKIRCGVATGKLTELKTFDDFYAAYLKQLDAIIENIILCSNDYEQYLHRISPAQVYSATIENSLKTAKDAFQDGSIYNISSILNAGFATAVDALMIIKRLVYERQELTLTQFRKILQGNWAGHEKLRLRVLRNPAKFGNGVAAADDLSEGLARFLADKINLRPNARNGFYVASMHSARTFIVLGEKTGATPDGRLAGEEMSKNISPTMGMDTNGVTALVQSVTKIDSAQFPGDFPLDVMMHPATVAGADGLAAMRILLKTYLAKHGIAIHFNIFDANVLLNAQKHPEKYEGLQVRVCGWNVRFNDIAQKEQDQYIKRALSIRE